MRPYVLWIAPSTEFVILAGDHQKQPRMCGRVRATSDTELLLEPAIPWPDPRDLDVELQHLRRLDIDGTPRLVLAGRFDTARKGDAAVREYVELFGPHRSR